MQFFVFVCLLFLTYFWRGFLFEDVLCMYPFVVNVDLFKQSHKENVNEM